MPLIAVPPTTSLAVSN